MNTDRRGKKGLFHSLSMRGAEIAFKMTSCRVIVVVREAAFQTRLDGESITLFPNAVLYYLWVSRSLHTFAV